MAATREALIKEWFRLWIGSCGYFTAEFQSKEHALRAQINFTMEEHNVLMFAVRAVQDQQL